MLGYAVLLFSALGAASALHLDVPEGEKIEISCQVRGITADSPIVWTKDSSILFHNNNSQKTVVPPRYIFTHPTRLTIDPVTAQDKGVYRCHVPGHPTQSYTLNVSEKGAIVQLTSEHYLRRRATTVFHDDFNSGHISTSKWQHDLMVGNPGSFNINSNDPKNSYIRNGVLYLRPTYTTDRFGSNILEHGTLDARQLWGDCRPTWGGCVTHDHDNRPIMSARIRSQGSGHITYGKVEVVAKLPLGDWLWPAIWLMPVDSVYGGWPKSGEMDIMEAACNLHYHRKDGHPVGIQCSHSNMHYGTGRDGNQHHHHGDSYCMPHGTFADDFHTYWLDWTENYIKMGVDDHTILAFNTPHQGYWNEAHLTGTNIWAKGSHSAPFDQKFYLILNNEVGGGYFWDGYVNDGYNRPWTHEANNGGWREFWNNRHLWQPSWHGEATAMAVKSVTMKQY